MLQHGQLRLVCCSAGCGAWGQSLVRQHGAKWQTRAVQRKRQGAELETL